jgi:hypothetical protein
LAPSRQISKDSFGRIRIVMPDIARWDAIRALWLEATIAARRPCRRPRMTNGEIARRAEGADADEKKWRNEPNHGRRNPGEMGTERC